MVIRVYLGALGFGLAGLVWVLWMPSQIQRDPLALLQSLFTAKSLGLLLMVLLHLPALVTVAQQRKLMGRMAHRFGQYPESLVPGFVFLGWLVLGWVLDIFWLGALAGLCTALGISLCYGLVRMLTAMSKQVEARIGGAARSEIAGVLRRIYQVRVLLTIGAALIGIYAFGDTNHLIALFPLVIFAAGAAVTLGDIARRALRDLPATAQANLALTVRAAQVKNPATIAIHYSGPRGSKHTALAFLAERLANEGLRVALINREPATSADLANVGVQQKWLAPSLDMLNACNQPEVQAAFYVNDSEKNGHFTRISSIAHILVATGEILDLRQLPPNFEMYDAIIAPNAQIATRWRLNSPPERAAKVSVITANGLALLPAAKTLPQPPRLALRLDTNEETGRLDDCHAACCINLLAALRAGADAKLCLSFPDAPKDAGSLALLAEARRAVDEGLAVTISQGEIEEGYNCADIIIARPADALARLRRTGKPLFWVGPGLPPKGLVAFGPQDDLTAALNQLIPLFGQMLDAAPHMENWRDFDSFGALVAHVLAQKAGR